MGKKYFYIIFLLMTTIFYQNNLLAAPEISSVSGKSINDSEVVIAGYNFGSKSPASPLLWDTFENGTNGVAIQNINAIIGSWDTGAGSDNVFYSTIRGYGGSAKSARHPFSSGYNSSLSKNAASFPIIFMDFKRYVPNLSNPPSNYKPWRWYGNSDGFQIFKGWGCESSSYSVQTDYESGGQSITNWTSPALQYDTWEHYRVIYNQGSVNTSNGTLIVTKNGVTDGYNSTALKIRTLAGSVINQIRIGHYFDSSNRGCGSNSGVVIFTDNVYIDNTWARVEIGNKPQYANCNHSEVQIPTGWSNSSISIKFNQGSFQSGNTAYLFVVDENGNVNSTGYPIVIGGGGDSPPPTSPAPPTGLIILPSSN